MPETAAGPSPQDDPVGALDALVPGLGDALVDLLDAVHDRTDDLGPARPDTLARLATRLVTSWPVTDPVERPLALLDSLRALLRSAVPVDDGAR